MYTSAERVRGSRRKGTTAGGGQPRERGSFREYWPFREAGEKWPFGEAGVESSATMYVPQRVVVTAVVTIIEYVCWVVAAP